MKRFMFVCLFAYVGSVDASSILVFGDQGGAQSSLTTSLTSQGHSVTNIATGSFPVDLSGFDTIWAVNTSSSYISLLAPLQGFLDSGKGIYFTGERACCEQANYTIETFLNSNVIGGGITVGRQGDLESSATFNSSLPKLFRITNFQYLRLSFVARLH